MRDVIAEPATVTDVLSLAADLIDGRGWCRRVSYGKHGEFSVDAALDYVLRWNYHGKMIINESDLETVDLARAALEAHLGRSVLGWNARQQGLTKEQVVATLRTVSEREQLAHA